MTIRTITLASPKNNFVLFSFCMDLDESVWMEKWLLDHLRNNVCYEPEVTQAMLRAIRPGDFVIDVGANMGFFTLLMAKLVGPEGKVLAFEPGRNVLPRLKQNIELNNFQNITVIEQPAWSKEEEITFHLNADSSGGNAVWDPGLWPDNVQSRNAPESYTVMTTTVDAHTKDQPLPRFIKIDTEGAEQHVLIGAELTKAAFVQAEFNQFGLAQLKQSGRSLRNLMYGREYDTFLIHPDGQLPSLVPFDSELTTSGSVSNILFSTEEAIAEAWPRVPYD